MESFWGAAAAAVAAAEVAVGEPGGGVSTKLPYCSWGPGELANPSRSPLAGMGWGGVRPGTASRLAGGGLEGRRALSEVASGASARGVRRKLLKVGTRVGRSGRRARLGVAFARWIARDTALICFFPVL